MGLFDKFFSKDKVEEVLPEEEPKETIKDRRDWYLSQEAEEIYHSLSFPEKIDHIFEFLLQSYVCDCDCNIKYVDEFERKKERVLYDDKKILFHKVAYLLVIFIINSKEQRFSGYKNALSGEINWVEILENSNDKQIARRILLSIEDRVPVFPESCIDVLTTYKENKELYTIERAILSIFEGDRTVDYYTYKVDISILLDNLKYYESIDPLFPEAVERVVSQQRASTALLQRHFGIGKNRAEGIIDMLEEMEVIGPARGAKPREVYIF